VDIVIRTHNYVQPCKKKSGLEQVSKMTFKEMPLNLLFRNPSALHETVYDVIMMHFMHVTVIYTWVIRSKAGNWCCLETKADINLRLRFFQYFLRFLV